MAAYLLNLTFKQANVDGLFNSDTVSPTSKRWYKVPSTWQPGTTPNVPAPVSVAADLASSQWTQAAPYPLKDDCLFFCNLSDDIYVRMAPDPAWANLQLSCSAAFGRPSTSGHSGSTMASPFILGAYPRTVFYWGAVTPTVVSDGSWIYYLGQPTLNQSGPPGPPLPGRLRAYSFIVSAVVFQGSSSAALCTYGHDPQMGVQG
jgi:hypothetical protein